MSLEKTTQVRIYSSEIKEVLSFLQKSALVEVIGSSRQDLGLLSRVEFVIDVLSGFQEKKSGLRQAVLGDKIEVDERDVRSIISSFDWEELEKEVGKCVERKDDILREKEEKQDFLLFLKDWEGVSYSGNKGRFGSVLFFEIPEKGNDEFLKQCRDEKIYVEQVSANGSFVRYAGFVIHGFLEGFKKMLSSLDGKVVDAFQDESPADVSARLTKDLEGLQESYNACVLKLKKLSVHLDGVKLWYDSLLQDSVCDKAVADSKAVGRYIRFVDVWVSCSKVSLLQYDLSREFETVFVEPIEKKDSSQESPVLLSASASLEPIQEVTKMYGAPSEKELDPTPYYAIFFIVFFGFCLTDAGYGLLLMLFTGSVLLLNLPFAREVKNVITMFFYGGVSTFILGVLFGGYFGLSADQVPSFLTYTRESDGVLLFLGQVFNPMTDLVSHIMPFAYVLGISHLLLGTYLSGVIAWNNGNTQRMYFFVIPCFLAIVFAFLRWGLGLEGIEYGLYACLALMTWGLGESGNPVVRVGKGVFGLINESLSWFSNILSYSRLFALGLATGIIAMAFNVVAMTLFGMVGGFFGGVIMIFVLLFGHTLNMSLNLLGAYVHSSRLQFVEFFGVFLQGGGRIFKPFRKENRYRYLPED